jgi:uncharacterized protein with PIN domain
MPGSERFVADHMLGKLARWLRLAGFDTLYLKPASYSDLICAAKKDGRTIVSRHTGLFKVREITGGEIKGLLLRDDDIDAQIKQVLTDLDIRISPVIRRCPEDNRQLDETVKEQARPFVPRYVYQTQQTFDRCAVCNRFYWRGTHYRSISLRLAGVLKEAS